MENNPASEPEKKKGLKVLKKIMKEPQEKILLPKKLNLDLIRLN